MDVLLFDHQYAKIVSQAPFHDERANLNLNFYIFAIYTVNL